MSVHALSESVARSFADATETAAHCAVTINARLPILAKCLFLPTPDGLTEWHEAYTEKVAAALEGTLAATSEIGSTMIHSAFAPRTPVGIADDFVRVIGKAVDPTRKRAEANAHRFSRPQSV